MTTGYFTTGPDGRLTDASVLTIDGTDHPIPSRTDAAGIFAPRRVLEAVRDAGYKPATDYYSDLGECDGAGMTIELVKA